MQTVAQQIPKHSNKDAKAPGWFHWMKNKPAQIKSIATESGQAFSLKERCPDLYQLSHVSWSPDHTHVSFVGNNRYVWLLSVEGKHTELLAMLPDTVNQSLSNSWSADSHAFHFSYMHENQLVDYEFDVKNRKLNIKEVA